MYSPLSRKCPGCGTHVSCFARFCRRCYRSNLPNPVAVGALLTIVLAAALLAVGMYFLRNRTASSTATMPEAPAAAAPRDTSADYGWIVKAMAECEEEAKVKTEILHFLI